jgi:cyclophilin family peptidyl-prolyl cis-trans isomerase
MRARIVLLALGCTLALRPPPASAEFEAGAKVVTGLSLDGRLDEEAWKSATVLPAEDVDTGKAQPAKADVRVLVAEGCLWIGAGLPEDPGLAVGVRAMVAPEGTASAADACAYAYSPLQAAGPLYVAQGPRGVGREAHRVAAAADLSKKDAWSVEMRVALADLGLPTTKTPLRLAVVVAARTPNRVSSAPPGAIFAGPATWARMTAPADGWPLAEDPRFDAAAMRAQDEADARRIREYRAFLAADAASPTLEAAKAQALPHLDAAIAARPDLATLLSMRGDVLARIGESDAAWESYGKALAIVPRLREAAWGRSTIRAARWVQRPGTEPSDFDAALARVEKESAGLDADDLAPDLARASLLYRRGDFEPSLAAFDRVVARHEGEPDLARAAKRAKSARALFSQETPFRAADEAKGNLPRVRLVTTRGAVVLELFEDDCPNTVANFVWLAEENPKTRWYDAAKVTKSVPFAHVEIGREPGEPGWALPAEAVRALTTVGGERRRPRGPFRGTVAMAPVGADSDGGRVLLLTGTQVERFGDVTVFGRVVEGQEAVDALVEGDAVERVEVLRKRDHAYHPKTNAGTPAPAPTGGKPR